MAITEGLPVTDKDSPVPTGAAITNELEAQAQIENVPASEPPSETRQEMIPALEDDLDDPPTPSLE